MTADSTTPIEPTPTRLVRAALRLIRQRGINEFTLDKVAAEAGTSKGGLLYHFPSKEELAAAMSEYLVAQFEQNLQRELSLLPAHRQPGQWTSAYIKATFSLDPAVALDSRTLFMLNAPYPKYLVLLQERYAEWQRQIENDGINPALASLTRLAADGLWFADVYELAPMPAALRQTILAELLTLLQG